MTHDEAVRIVSYLSRAFPVPAWEIHTMRLWCAELADLDYEPTLAAAVAWVRNETRQPLIADIRCGVARSAAPLRDTLTAEEAWGYVVECFTRIGSYREFPAKHIIVKQAVDVLGWQTLCASDNQVADRAHFFRVYQALLDRAVSRVATGDFRSLLEDLESKAIAAKP